MMTVEVRRFVHVVAAILEIDGRPVSDPQVFRLDGLFSPAPGRYQIPETALSFERHPQTPVHGWDFARIRLPIGDRHYDFQLLRADLFRSKQEQEAAA